MTTPIDTEMARLIAAMWKRNRAQVESRLHLLESAAAANRRGEMGEELRQEAREIAHKLAGSLGMFGFAESGAIARQVEMLFRSEAADAGLLLELTVRLRESLVEQD